MNSDQQLKPGVIAIVEVTFYTIENGELKALGKKYSGSEIDPTILKSINNFYPEENISEDDIDDRDEIRI